jgi:hypothetical protein
MAAAFGRRLVHARRDKALLFEAVERDIDRAAARRPVRPALDFIQDGGARRGVAKVQHGHQDRDFEFAEW